MGKRGLDFRLCTRKEKASGTTAAVVVERQRISVQFRQQGRRCSTTSKAFLFKSFSGKTDNAKCIYTTVAYSKTKPRHTTLTLNLTARAKVRKQAIESEMYRILKSSGLQ